MRYNYYTCEYATSLEEAFNLVSNKTYKIGTIPSISLFKDVFDTNNYDLCNYMLRTLTIQKEFQNKLCAVCHIDNTTRP